METPRDVAKRCCPLGKPFEDEIEDAIARYVQTKDRRIAELEAALRTLVIDSQNADFPGGNVFWKSLKYAIAVLGDDPR